MQLQFPNGHQIIMTAKICNCELDGVCIYQLFMLEMSREYFAFHQIGDWNTTTLYTKPQAKLIYTFQPPQRWASKVDDVKRGAYPISSSCLFIDTNTGFLQSTKNGRKTTYTWMKHNFSDEAQIYQVVYRVPTWVISFGLQLSVQLQEGEDMEKKKMTELIKQKESTSGVQNLGEELATKVVILHLEDWTGCCF